MDWRRMSVVANVPRWGTWGADAGHRVMFVDGREEATTQE